MMVGLLRRGGAWIALALFVQAAAGAGKPGITATARPRPMQAIERHVEKEAQRLLGKTDLYFEPNVGQSDPSVKAVSRGAGFMTLLTGKDAYFVNKMTKRPIQMELLHSNHDSPVSFENELPGKSNYFYGKDPAKWKTDVPHYSTARFKNVYKGIDMVYYSGEKRMEYDFIVASGADPGKIEFAWKGVEESRIDENGDILLTTSAGLIRHRKPTIYQEINGEKVAVAGGYRQKKNGTFAFDVADYKREYALVIDPLLFYSTYIGGSQVDDTIAITVDALGPVYVAGSTLSANLPVSLNPYQKDFAGVDDGYVIKLNVTATFLVYATFIGGENSDRINGIAADQFGNAYLTGVTFSFGFPTTQRAYQRNFSGIPADAFVAKLGAEGNQLAYSTFVGVGSTTEVGLVIGVDSAGIATVAGTTDGTGFPISQTPLDATYNGTTDIWLLKMDSIGSTLLFSTYIGGQLEDVPTTMLLDPGGDIYMCGYTSSPDFPTTPGVIKRTLGGFNDGWVMKISQNGKKMIFSTLIGGSDQDVTFGLGLEPGGRMVLAGHSISTDFPVTTGAYQPASAGSFDAYVVRLNSNATKIIAASFIGSTALEFGYGARSLDGGHIIISGYTTSNNFPTTPDAFQASSNASGDGFLVILAPLANAVRFSTVLGGGGTDVIRSIAQDASGDIYVGGQTGSTTFRTTPDSIYPTYRGGGADGFVAKVTDFNVSECLATVALTTTTFQPEGGAASVGIGTGCPWYGFTSTTFAKLTSNPLSQGVGSLNFTMDPNTSADPRTATIYAAGNLMHLMQKGASTVAPFNDVSNADAFVDFVRIIKSNGVTSGCTPVNYCPGDATSRGQMAVFLIRGMLGTDDFTFQAAPFFTDVPATHSLFKWIQKLRELGITTGCTQTEYCPDSPVTRGQMATFLIRSRFGSTFKYPVTPFFQDVPTINIFFPFVQKLKQLGITAGCTANTFCPDSSNTRGQMAVFLTRMFFTTW